MVSRRSIYQRRIVHTRARVVASKRRMIWRTWCSTAPPLWWRSRSSMRLEWCTILLGRRLRGWRTNRSLNCRMCSHHMDQLDLGIQWGSSWLYRVTLRRNQPQTSTRMSRLTTLWGFRTSCRLINPWMLRVCDRPHRRCNHLDTSWYKRFGVNRIKIRNHNHHHRRRS